MSHVQGKFSAGFAIALLLIPAAVAADTKDKTNRNNDQQAYCNYVTEQATAQRDLLLMPDAVAGITQPNTGLPMQVVWGVSGSLSNVRKAGLTMDAARKNCDLYAATIPPARYPICPAESGEAGAAKPAGTDPTSVREPGRADSPPPEKCWKRRT